MSSAVATRSVLIRTYKFRKFILCLKTRILCFVKCVVSFRSKTFIPSLINENFRASGNIHFRIDHTSNLTIVLCFFYIWKINFCFRWTLITTLVVANRCYIGFMTNLNTSFSYFKTSMHLLIYIGHFIWLNWPSFLFKLSFSFGIILIQKAKETLMMIWICVFVYNTKTVTDSDRSLCSHHVISIVRLVSVKKFFTTAVIKLFCFTNQRMISVRKTNTTRALFAK